MEFTLRLTGFLRTLTEAVDGNGDDVVAVLSVLTDDVTGAVPSFSGLSMTIGGASEPVTFSAMGSRAATKSIGFPISPLVDPVDADHPTGNDIVFYAGEVGAFLALARDVVALYGPNGRVVLDRHLPPPDPAADVGHLDALEQRSTIDLAACVLIEQGVLPTRAYAELEPPAAHDHITVHSTARRIILSALSPRKIDAVRGFSMRIGGQRVRRGHRYVRLSVPNVSEFGVQ